MNNLNLDITNVAGASASQSVVIGEGGGVAFGAMQYSPNEYDFQSAHTESVDITHADHGTLHLTGDAWRTIEDQGAVSDLIMLFSLDQAAARKVVEIAAQHDCVLKTIVTREETSSCRVITLCKDDDPIDAARNGSVFELDEGNYKDRSQHSIGDTEELSIGEYVEELLRDARQFAEQSVARKANAPAHEVVTAASNLLSALQWEIDYGERGLGRDSDIVSAMEALRRTLI